MRVRLHSGVHLDIFEIMEHYESVAGTDLAAEFYFEFRRVVSEAATRPYSFAASEDDLRRVNFRKFPHHILFDIGSDSITILVVKHNHRNPEFGKGRR